MSSNLTRGTRHHSVTRLALCFGMASRVGEFEEPQGPKACSGFGNRYDHGRVSRIGIAAAVLKTEGSAMGV